MISGITYAQATLDYFHYLSQAGQSYITFVEWLRKYDVHTIMDDRMKRFLKATGMVGNITWAEVKAFVAGKIDAVKNALQGSIDKVSNALNAWIYDLKVWIANIFKAIGNLVNTVAAVVLNIGKYLLDSFIKILQRARFTMRSNFRFTIETYRPSPKGNALWSTTCLKKATAII